MKRIRTFLSFLLILSLAGCASPPEPSYDPAAFSCTLVIDSVSTGDAGRFTAELDRRDGRAILTLTAPDRLAGVTFTFSGEDCILSADGCMIPLSRDVSGSLRKLTALLALPPEEAADRQKTADGTILFHEGGQVTLDAAGMPVLIRTDTGRQAAVTMHTP